MKFINFSQLNDYLDNLGLFHMDLTLDRVRKFVSDWGKVGSFKSIHVVGTNGKGSTSSYLSSISIASGKRTGLYTSPHFITPRERIKIQGEMLSEEEWVNAANMVMDISPDCGLTYFEFLTCMAFVLFETHGVDVAIMEAGLGGLYDATTIIRPDLTVFVPIGMDHENILGHSLGAIAKDKSGAIQADGVCVTAAQDKEALNVLEDRSAEVGAILLQADQKYFPAGAHLRLHGDHQLSNAVLACTAWSEFCNTIGLKFDFDNVRNGLTKAFIPGRLQTVILEREFVLDGAHNIHAFRALEKAVEAMEDKPDHIIFGCMRDKDLTQIKPILKRLTKGSIIATGIYGNERALPENDLAGLIGERSIPAPNIKVALELLPLDAKKVLICGSLFLLASFYTIYPEFLE